MVYAPKRLTEGSPDSVSQVMSCIVCGCRSNHEDGTPKRVKDLEDHSSKSFGGTNSFDFLSLSLARSNGN
jgi:hypothetical protein